MVHTRVLARLTCTKPQNWHVHALLHAILAYACRPKMQATYQRCTSQARTWFTTLHL